jgi:hypothetical protein
VTALTACVFVAGVGQLVLAGASLAIPRLLRWNDDLARLRPLTRQVFWTYAGYIWMTNICFGILSALAPSWLLDGSPLARVVASYIALYWGARVIIQFAYFDRSAAPPGLVFHLAEAALVGLFIFLTAVYSWVAVA